MRLNKKNDRDSKPSAMSYFFLNLTICVNIILKLFSFVFFFADGVG